MSEHREYHLLGDSKSDGAANAPGSAGELIDGHFDFALLSSSWDPRCLSISGADVSFGTTALFLFENRGTSSLRDSHDRALVEFTERTSSNRHLLTGRSEDLHSMWTQLEGLIREVRSHLRRPIRMLIDLSACPRYYALATTALSLREALASTVTVFYAEGNYEDRDAGDVQEVFTLGMWEAVEIPYLEGTYDPEKTRFMLVSLGFEGSKTYRAVSLFDPDRLGILFPDPGTRPDYPDRTWKENYSLLEEDFVIPDNHIVRAPAGDAIAAWRRLAGRNLETFSAENVYYLCSGTKPHSLALSLRALTHGEPAVLYAKPAAHRESSIAPSGVFWSYRITDLSNPLG